MAGKPSGSAGDRLVFQREEGSEMAGQSKAKSGQSSDDLRDMRHQAHRMGIEGSSKMSMEQLNSAMKMVNKGTDPMMAKQQAKSKSR
jgi:hypothetical protein